MTGINRAEKHLILGRKIKNLPHPHPGEIPVAQQHLAGTIIKYLPATRSITGGNCNRLVGHFDHRRHPGHAGQHPEICDRVRVGSRIVEKQVRPTPLRPPVYPAVGMAQQRTNSGLPGRNRPGELLCTQRPHFKMSLLNKRALLVIGAYRQKLFELTGVKVFLLERRLRPDPFFKIIVHVYPQRRRTRPPTPELNPRSHRKSLVGVLPASAK